MGKKRQIKAADKDAENERRAMKYLVLLVRNIEAYVGIGLFLVFICVGAVYMLTEYYVKCVWLVSKGLWAWGKERVRW